MSRVHPKMLRTLEDQLIFVTEELLKSPKYWREKELIREKKRVEKLMKKRNRTNMKSF